jgi:hypothetical protein
MLKQQTQIMSTVISVVKEKLAAGAKIWNQLEEVFSSYFWVCTTHMCIKFF